MASPRGWDQADLEALEVLRPLLDNCPRQGGKQPFATEVAHPTPRGYLPWTEGALRPAALVEVCNEVALANRRALVELGAGVSTVVLGRLARERGARLTSLEHDPAWGQVVRGHLVREGLDGVVTLIEAPLEPTPLAIAGAPWYGADAVASLPGAIDLLLVDGPPAYGDGMALARYPALPALADRLAPGALVMLDDADREGEREVLERWGQAARSWTFSAIEHAGLAVGRHR